MGRVPRNAEVATGPPGLAVVPGLAQWPGCGWDVLGVWRETVGLGGCPRRGLFPGPGAEAMVRLGGAPA